MIDGITYVLLAVLLAGMCLLAMAIPVSGQTVDASTLPASVEPALGAGAPDSPTDLATGVPGASAPSTPASDVAAPPTEEALLDMAKDVIAAVRAGHWREAVAGVLILVFSALVRFGRRIPGVRRAWSKGEDGEWVLNDEGGSWLLFGSSFAGALATSLLGAAPVDLAMFRAALWVGLGAAGGYTVIWKRMLRPLLARAWRKVAGASEA